ncbi:MAG: hypothetical protein WDN28_31015 [Chthoniobacter sp.]
MKPLANSILLACFAAQISLAAEPSKPIQDLTLDDHTVYVVPVSAVASRRSVFQAPFRPSTRLS